ncbi:NAD-dependent epimerase/dehydratase family protein [Chloroflexota bacterium]
MGTVLVTGGAGHLGVYVVRSLADAGEQVVMTYRRYFSAPQLLSDVMESKVKAVRCDVLDLPELSRVIRDHGVDSIVHLANTSNYEAPIYTCLQTNVLGTINVMEAAAIGSVKKVTYMSSSTVTHGPGGYTGPESELVDIASPPVGVVPPSKKVGEVLSLNYGASFGIPVIIVRTGGNFWGPFKEGPIGQAGLLRDVMEGVTMGKPVNLPGSSREDEFRIIFVRDMADGISLVHTASQNQHLVYCVTEKEPTNWGEIAEIIKEFVLGAKITFGKSSQPTKAQMLSEELNITSEFGFKSKCGLRGGLREYIEWYQNGKP